MYNLFINTHPLNTCAETLQNIQPEKPREPRVEFHCWPQVRSMEGGTVIIAVLWHYYYRAFTLSRPRKWLKGQWHSWRSLYYRLLQNSGLGLKMQQPVAVFKFCPKNSPMHFLHFNSSLYSVQSDTVVFRDTCTEAAAQIKPAHESFIVSFKDSKRRLQIGWNTAQAPFSPGYDTPAPPRAPIYSPLKSGSEM